MLLRECELLEAARVARHLARELVQPAHEMGEPRARFPASGLAPGFLCEGQQPQQHALEAAGAHQLLDRLALLLGGPPEIGHRSAGGAQQGRQGGRTHVLVARVAERIEHRHERGLPVRRHGRGKRLHAVRAGAQAPQAHAQLVHVLGIAAAVRDLGGVGQDLRDARRHHASQHRVAVHRAGLPGAPRRRPCLDRTPERLAAGQQRAAPGLGHRIEPQAVQRLPIVREAVEAGRIAALEFELELGDGSRAPRRGDLAFIQRPFDHGAARAQHSAQSRHFGAAALDQRRMRMAPQQRAQPASSLGVAMAGEIERRRAAIGVVCLDGHLVFEAARPCRLAGLERLDPMAVLAAQAQREAVPRQQQVGRVEVDRRQHATLDPPVPQGVEQPAAPARLHVQLDFAFGHGVSRGNRRAPTAAAFSVRGRAARS